jgi:hypothetical protein
MPPDADGFMPDRQRFAHASLVLAGLVGFVLGFFRLATTTLR